MYLFFLIVVVFYYIYKNVEVLEVYNSDEQLEVYKDNELFNLSDKEILTRTIWAESRASSDLEQGLVGQVIINRVRDNRFPDTIKKVCLQDKQFSPWNAPVSKTDNSYKVRLKNLTDKQSYKEVEKITEKVLNGFYETKISDNTCHFIAVDHNRIRTNGSRIISAYVSWAVGAEIEWTGDHYFLRGVN